MENEMCYTGKGADIILYYLIAPWVISVNYNYRTFALFRRIIKDFFSYSSLHLYIV